MRVYYCHWPIKICISLQVLPKRKFYGQAAFQPPLNSFSTSQMSLSAFEPFSLQALQISFSHFPPLKPAFNILALQVFNTQIRTAFSILQLFHFSFWVFPIFSFTAFLLLCSFSASLSPYSLLRLFPVLLFSFLATKRLWHSPVGLSAISASQISYLSSCPFFVHITWKIKWGRKKMKNDKW